MGNALFGGPQWIPMGSNSGPFQSVFEQPNCWNSIKLWSATFLVEPTMLNLSKIQRWYHQTGTYSLKTKPRVSSVRFGLRGQLGKSFKDRLVALVPLMGALKLYIGLAIPPYCKYRLVNPIATKEGIFRQTRFSKQEPEKQRVLGVGVGLTV